MNPDSVQDDRPPIEDARPAVPRARRVLDVLLLLGPICLVTAVTVPGIGIGIVATAWGGGAGAAVLALLAGIAVLTWAIAVASHPGRALIHSADSRADTSADTWPRRLRWAAGVCLLGTLVVAIGGFLWSRDRTLFGSAPTRIWLVGAAYALAAAARSRPRVLRRIGIAGCGGAAALSLALAALSAPAPNGPPRPTPVTVQSARISDDLLLVGDTPAGYRPVPVSISPDSGPPSPFIADYACVANCPPESSPGHAATITFTAAPGGPRDFSVYQSLCGAHPSQGYVCSALGPDMWRATVPSSPTVYQTVIYEHDGIEFTLSAPPSMDPQLLRAYLLSIHRASTAELVSLLQGYPNYG